MSIHRQRTRAARVHLEVRTLDTQYQINDQTENISITPKGMAAIRLTRFREGLFETPLPTGTDHLDLKVEASKFWPIQQGATIRWIGARPSLEFYPKQAVNVRNFEVTSRGDDWTIRITVVLGQLRDASEKVRELLGNNANQAPTATPFTNSVRLLNEAPLDDHGLGWNRLRHQVIMSEPDGALFFAERPSTPKLFAIYVPKRRFVTSRADDSPAPNAAIPYHIFFHPHPSAAKFPGNYPFSNEYIDLAYRYMIAQQMHNVGKAMICQHKASGKRPVFIFPIGSSEHWFGSLPQQSALLQLLHETSFWTQRMNEITYPIHRVGKCAVSAFSAGCDALSTMLQTPDSTFDADHLREIYGLDLFLPSASQVRNMVSSLGRWLRNGQQGRRLRIYTQSEDWRAAVSSLLQPHTTSGRPNSTWGQSESGSLLFDHAAPFWSEMGREAPQVAGDAPSFERVPTTYDEVHQFHPAIFMSHALRLSTFADP